jgi:hypothetical protein
MLAATIAATGLRAQDALSADTKASYKQVRTNLLKAAEKMPESDYDFKPTSDVRTFGQLIAHVTEAQMFACGLVKGDAKRGDAAPKAMKADLVAALQASSNYCDPVYDAMSDKEGSAIVKTPFGQKPKLGVLNFNVAHDNETYGTLALYLRLKGIVPPSSEGR